MPPAKGYLIDIDVFDPLLLHKNTRCTARFVMSEIIVQLTRNLWIPLKY